VETAVPQGWRGIRSDFAHFCRMHGAEGLRGKLWVLLVSKSFWGLAIYRFGRWVYSLPRLPSLPLRALYQVVFEAGRRITKTSFAVLSHIEEEVWMAPQGEIFCSWGSRIGRGSMIFGQNTLGVGGRAGTRGHPQLGERVVMCPGAAAIGPVVIAGGAILGPNSLAGRSVPREGSWAGIPAKLSKVPIAPPAVSRPPRLWKEEQHTMQPEPFWPAFRADLQRFYIYLDNPGFLTRLRVALVSDGAWAMGLYRFGRSLRTLPPPRLFAPILWMIYRLSELFLGLLTSVSIDVDAEIAPGFYVGHFVSVRIGPGVRIGRNCSISQMCMLEGIGAFPARSAPVLGERVYIGSGAKVIGPYKIGAGAALCANTVVAGDVPEEGVVMGAPGVVISRRGSGEFIYLGAGTGVRDEVPLQRPSNAESEPHSVLPASPV
jgi:serine O-acetyltransferase